MISGCCDVDWEESAQCSTTTLKSLLVFGSQGALSELTINETCTAALSSSILFPDV